MSEASDPIFAKIAARYDLINGILSMGQEKKWRRSGIQQLDQGLTLDLGSGTGDTDFEGREVIALDPVAEMLALSPVNNRVVAIGEELPFKDESFDAVFSGFVFRNLTSIDKTLVEVERVLRPGKSAVVIDLTRPINPILRFFHRLGTAITLPLVGLVFAGAPREYWYLHRSLDSLPAPESLFSRGGMAVDEVWRMGLFGFVYGVKLRKEDVS